MNRKLPLTPKPGNKGRSGLLGHACKTDLWSRSVSGPCSFPMLMFWGILHTKSAEQFLFKCASQARGSIASTCAIGKKAPGLTALDEDDTSNRLYVVVPMLLPVATGATAVVGGAVDIV